jgi:hypothetical protein
MLAPRLEEEGVADQFLKTLTVGGSAVGLTLLFPMSGLRAAGQIEALLLSCMDFRLVDNTARYMASRGLTDKYDHIILVGAALGALGQDDPGEISSPQGLGQGRP